MKNILISCIGDSLTEGDYGLFGKTGIANVHKENYPYFLSKLSKCTVNNFGHCGFRSSEILKMIKDGTINVKGSNIIVIILGTNGGQTPSGESEEDLAYFEIINQCKNQCPNAHIYLCTPPHCTENPYYSGCGIAEQVKNAALFVRMVSSKLNLPLIDLYSNKTFSSETEKLYQSNDGVHFNKEGYKKLAEIIFDNIQNSLKNI